MTLLLNTDPHLVWAGQNESGGGQREYYRLAELLMSLAQYFPTWQWASTTKALGLLESVSCR